MKAFFRQVGASTIERAERVLPQELPLGLGHGDYAMRNILVTNNCRGYGDRYAEQVACADL